MESIALLWQRIEQWFASHAPHILDTLHPGASEEELVQAESALGVPLPEDFKASYRIHNGGGSAFLAGGMRRGRLGPLKDVVQAWSGFQVFESDWAEAEPSFLGLPLSQRPPIQPVWYHPRLIPFANDESGQYWCLDLDPAPGGHLGQVIFWDHENGPGHVLFPNFETLLSQWADDLEADKYYSVGLDLERRKERREEASPSKIELPSPAAMILDYPNQLVWEGERGSEDEKITPYLPVVERLAQVFQRSPLDGYSAYRKLIILYRSEAEQLATDPSTGQVLSLASIQQIKAHSRKEAEQLLASFEGETQPVPAEPGAHDDLQEQSEKGFETNQILQDARQMAADRYFQCAAMALVLTLYWNKGWFTAEERFALYGLVIDLHFQQQQIGQARVALAHLAAEAQKRPPEDPVHETVRYWATKL